MRIESQKVRIPGDRWKGSATKQFNRSVILELGQIELNGLRKSREICNHQDTLLLILANENQNFSVPGPQKLQRATTKGLVALAQRKRSLHPPKKRIGIALLRFHVDCLVVIFGIQID